MANVKSADVYLFSFKPNVKARAAAQSHTAAALLALHGERIKIDEEVKGGGGEK